MNKLLGVFLFCLAAIGTPNAAIIDHGDYLTDTNSGLDWLDVTSSVNMSYNYVSGQFGSGGLFEGWRYASGDEFNILVGHYTGTPISTYDAVNQEPDKIDGLVILLGSTLDAWWLYWYGSTFDNYYGYADGSGYDYTIGLLSDKYSPDNNMAAILFDNDIPQGQIPYNIEDIDFSAAHHANFYGSDYISYGIGSYLVRVSSAYIPEPSTALLLMAASLGLVVTRAYRKPPANSPL